MAWAQRLLCHRHLRRSVFRWMALVGTTPSFPAPPHRLSFDVLRAQYFILTFIKMCLLLFGPFMYQFVEIKIYTAYVRTLSGDRFCLPACLFACISAYTTSAIYNDMCSRLCMVWILLGFSLKLMISLQKFYEKSGSSCVFLILTSLEDFISTAHMHATTRMRNTKCKTQEPKKWQTTGICVLTMIYNATIIT